ncbi:type I restriction enzyme HsdR N-terminal domain-containing protein [Clostridium sp. UBA7791]|uniref:type I restriction enzyme HsdR N-terminal domain-containing protein n=1 Tax=Clostridium sp. UBA7791 TaxID=1946379 RepID=UPI003217F416
MNKKILNELKVKYRELPEDTSEENIKIKIVIKFLELLGYDENHFYYEENTNKKIKDKQVDITILTNNKEKDIFYIEVKKKNHMLVDADIRQISSYLHDKHIEWGLLTNGNHYILINEKLDVLPHNKDIFSYYLCDIPNNISRKNNLDTYNFLEYDSIFETKITNYYLVWKEFILKNTLSSSSLFQYSSAYNMFIKYLIMKKNVYNLNYFNISNFKSFIEDINETKVNKYKKDSVLSKFNYLLRFTNFLEENKRIAENTFKNFDINNYIDELNLTEKKSKQQQQIKLEEIELMLQYLNSKKNSIRNKLLFLLVLYGFESTDIILLKDSQLDFKHNKIIINKKKYPLTENIKKLLQDIIIEKKQNKIKCEYIFYTKYQGGYKHISRSVLNDVINDSFNKLNLDKDRALHLNIQFIKSSLIKNLYFKNYSLEEISYFTNLSISSIVSYIDEKEISKHSIPIIKDINLKHPYSKFI